MNLPSNITPKAPDRIPEVELTNAIPSCVGFDETDGEKDGKVLTLGKEDGDVVGSEDGLVEMEGRVDGTEEGMEDGRSLGALVGSVVIEGSNEGMVETLGADDGVSLGELVG